MTRPYQTYLTTTRTLRGAFYWFASTLAWEFWDLISKFLNCLASLSHSFLWMNQCIFWQSRLQYWTDLQMEHLLGTFSWPQVAHASSSWKPRWPFMQELRRLRASWESKLCFVFERLTNNCRNTVVSLKGKVRTDSLIKLSMNSGNPSEVRGFRNAFTYWLINSKTGLSECCCCSLANLSTRNRK